MPTTDTSVASNGADAPLNDVRFATASRLEWHRALFRSYAHEPPLHSSEPVSQAERCDEVQSADAGHDVPERGDGQKVNPPTLVAWSPKGDRLFTAADAWGLKIWWADRLGMFAEDVKPYAYGYPSRFFVTQRGSSHRILQETHSNRHEYYLLHDGEGRKICEGINGRPWGLISLGGDSSLNATREFNPWRPGSSFEIAVVDGDDSVNIVDIGNIDATQEAAFAGVEVTGITIVDQVINLWRGRRARQRYRPGKPLDQRSPLHETSPSRVLRFAPLGARASSIMDYLWHPSGEYLAVVAGDWDEREQLRTHVVHVASGEIVLSIPATSAGVAWSPGGRYLLLKRWEPDSKTARMEVWDSVAFEMLRADTEVERLLDQPWALHGLHRAPTTPGSRFHSSDTTLSSDGRRMLCQNGTCVTSVQRVGSEVTPGHTIATVSHTPFAHAAWSPVDPMVFATVGGAPSEKHPDTYPAHGRGRPHGRLLRVWKLSN